MSEGDWVVVPLEIAPKIEQKENWILGFSGMSEDIEKIKEIFCKHINANQGFVKIQDEILKLFKKIKELDVEGLFCDIIKKKCYRILFSKLDSNKGLKDYEVYNVDACFIGTGPNKARHLLNQLRDLETYNLTEEPDFIIRESVSALDHCSRADGNTGNPYVFGCDIFIIKDGKAKKYEIQRNGVRFREENKGDWKKLEL